MHSVSCAMAAVFTGDMCAILIPHNEHLANKGAGPLGIELGDWNKVHAGLFGL